jgi:GAF domain
MPNRFRPDPELSTGTPLLQQRLQERAGLVDGAWLRSAPAALARTIIESAFVQCGASEGTIWLLRGAMLVPATNTGPNAMSLIDRYEQPVERGLIGMVAVTEQAFCERDMRGNAQMDGTLDTRLGVQTTAMMAVPLAFGGALRAVVSCVQLAGQPDLRPFGPEDLDLLERQVSAAGRLLDLALFESILGLPGV